MKARKDDVRGQRVLGSVISYCCCLFDVTKTNISSVVASFADFTSSQPFLGEQ